METLSVIAVSVAAIVVSGFVVLTVREVPEPLIWSDPVNILSEDVNHYSPRMEVFEFRFDLKITPTMSQVQLRIELVDSYAYTLSIINSSDYLICSMGDWAGGLDPGNHTTAWTDILPGNYNVSVNCGYRLKGHLTVLARSIGPP
ncbi:MAG: hypothetical protein ACW99U_13970 [Candidatus Thorarchaeota archaeon]